MNLVQARKNNQACRLTTDVRLCDFPLSLGRRTTMAARVLETVLLLGLASVSAPAYAQGVFLRVCNAGTVDVDVFVSRAGRISSTHIGPADCAAVAESAGAMGPAYLGLAFIDSRGQWGAARRLDLLPDLGSGVLSRATRTATVPHGNAPVSLLMPLLLRPAVPACRDYQTSSAAAQLPLNATPAQRRAAAAEDTNRPPGQTVCDTVGYTLNVQAYAETREITFRQECDPCDKKADATLTPEERVAQQQREAAANRVIGTLSGLGPAGAVFGGIVQRQQQEEVEERRARESRLSPTQRMEWSALLPALRSQSRSQGLWDVIPRTIVIRGTVSSVDVSKDTFEPIEWVDVAFRESPITDGGPRRPYSEFNVCASGREIFQSVFGPDFLTSMIGKVIEVEGETQGAYCRGLMGSIRVTLAQQIRLVKPAGPPAASAPRSVPPRAKPTASGKKPTTFGK
jgi:hypothetical protein